MKKNLIIVSLVIIVFLILSYFIFLYRSDFQVCLSGKTCTMDVRTICNPTTREYKTLPSHCSCGISAGVLVDRGWIDCPER